MTTHDDELARKITGYLDHGTASMRAGTAYRLQLARQAALDRLQAPERVAQSRLAPALVGSGSARSGGRGFWANGKLWIGIGLIVAASVGYQGYQSWQVQQQTKDLIETDAEILTSDLPIDAYLDRGFQNWLKNSDDR